jgi:CubicO group peptidase (beta-lactamase class C family)
MRFASAVTVILFALLLTRAWSQSFSSVSEDLSSIMSSFTNIYAAAVVTQDSTGTKRVATGAAGFANPLTQTPMMPDSPVNGNTAGELFVAMLTMKLVRDGNLPGLDQSIPTNLMPCSMTNPFDAGSFLTLRQLLSHTSRLVDDTAKFQTTSASSAGSSQQSLRTFVLNYFAVQSATGFSCASGLFQQSLPSGAYSYARANVLLLSYIIESTISQNLALVQSSQKTIGSFMQEAIFNTIGLDGTYFLLPDGSNPRRSINFMQFDSKAVQEMSSLTSTASTRLFGGYTADFMLRTTASDLAKVTRSLFLDTRSTFYPIGEALKTFINATDNGRVHGMVQQGLGVISVSSAYVCTQGRALLGMSTGCSLGGGAVLFGVVAAGRTSAVSSLCAAVAGTTTCTSVALAYATSGTASREFETQALTSSATSVNALFAIAAAASNNVLISPLLSQGTTIMESDQSPPSIFGFEVFISVFLSFVGVLALAYFSEYFIQPVPLIGGLTAKAYPTLSEHIDRSMNAVS